MTILDILRFPVPRLRTRCQPVEVIDQDMLKLADDMDDTMKHFSGVGLSAIQVGRFIRLLVADTSSMLEGNNSRYQQETSKETANGRVQEGDMVHEYEKKIEQPIVLFNPVIVDKKGAVVFKEGCLSFPSYSADVKRSAYVEVEGLNKEGKLVRVKTDGFLSICLQHEIDHLDGKLFIDHLSSYKAQRLRDEIKKYGYPQQTKALI